MSDELKILQVMGPGLTIHIHCLHVNLQGLLVLRTVPYGQSFFTPVVKIQIKVYECLYYSKRYVNVKSRDEDPVLTKNRTRGSVPETKGDFYNSIE